jgi:ubiquinone/menaquinone biosynthesis C-methylase UbiE
MVQGSKRDAWRDAAKADRYEARRFSGPLQRLKHHHDVGLVLELLRTVPGVHTVLDLPVGTGRLLPELRAAGYRVAGVDRSLEMLRAGRRTRPGEPAPLVQADAGSLPFPDATFDAVVSLRFLFHLDHDERRAALLEMARVARGGIVLGQLPWSGSVKARARSLRGRAARLALDRRAIETELAAAGLELTVLRPVSFLFSDKVLFLARPRTG